MILDVDTGTDDAVALMVAALSPDIELIGATSVNGNTGVEYLRDLGTPAGEAAARSVLQRIAGYAATQPIVERSGVAPIHDALAVCAIIDPTILTTRFIPVDVEVNAELSYGRTVCDFRSRPDKPANVHFAVDADEPKFVRMLLDILGRVA